MRDFSGLLDWEHYSVVLTSYSVASPRFHRVVPNQYAATQLAVRELRARGYRRIGLVVPPWVEERVNYFHSVAFTWEASREQKKPLLCYHDPAVHPLAHIRTWCRAHRPDALVLCSPLDYELVLCKALGRAAVARLGIVSLGYETQCANTTTVDYQPALLGAIAVDQLHQPTASRGARHTENAADAFGRRSVDRGATFARAGPGWRVIRRADPAPAPPATALSTAKAKPLA